MPRLQAALVSLVLATASVPVTLAAQSTDGAVPGSLNFVQGQANIDGQPISSPLDFAHPQQLHAGQRLATAAGSADILLAPGALLRLGRNSMVEMVAANQDRTEVRLEQGLGNVSVHVVRHDHLLLVDLPSGQTQVVSPGLYTFNGAEGTLRVFHGEAEVFPGVDTSANVKPIKVKEGHALVLSADRSKPEAFDRELEDSDLLPWTGPRESQAALANDGAVHDASYATAGGYGYAGYGGYPGGYGFAGPFGYGNAFGYGYGNPYFAYDGFGYPYGPYGFGGYPFFGVGFGFFGGGYYGGGYGYGGGYPVRGPGRFGGGNPPHGSAPTHGFASAGGAGRGFGGGGGFHGGGGHR